MKSHKKFSIYGAIVLALMLVSSVSQAAITTYTNRTAFEAALNSFSVDALNGVAAGPHFSDVRPGYTITSPQLWGCINQAGCSDNSGIGFDSAYLWNYPGQDTVTFATPANGFGFDFGNPLCCGTNSQAMIEGFTSPSTSGFFGVISDVAMSSFSLNQTDAYMLIDNITYGSSSSVPEPSTFLLFAGSFLAFALTRRVSGK